jgi:hypothetical protein
MKGKCACLADFFLLQKKEGDYSRLIRENKIIGIACRVAASSNKMFRYALRWSDGLIKILPRNQNNSGPIFSRQKSTSSNFKNL